MTVTDVMEIIWTETVATPRPKKAEILCLKLSEGRLTIGRNHANPARKWHREIRPGHLTSAARLLGLCTSAN
jgi:hypothetical protein